MKWPITNKWVSLPSRPETRLGKWNTMSLLLPLAQVHPDCCSEILERETVWPFLTQQDHNWWFSEDEGMWECVCDCVSVVVVPHHSVLQNVYVFRGITCVLCRDFVILSANNKCSFCRLTILLESVNFCRSWCIFPRHLNPHFHSICSKWMKTLACWKWEEAIYLIRLPSRCAWKSALSFLSRQKTCVPPSISHNEEDLIWKDALLAAGCVTFDQLSSTYHTFPPYHLILSCTILFYRSIAAI